MSANWYIESSRWITYTAFGHFTDEIFCFYIFFVLSLFLYLLICYVIYNNNFSTLLSCDFILLYVRERPFNLKGGGGGYGFFLKKYSDSQCCWKKYSDFGGGKKKCDSEFLSYNLMLNFGKNCALRDKKNKYSNSRVVRKNNFWTKQKTINLPPPCKLNGRSLSI